MKKLFNLICGILIIMLFCSANALAITTDLKEMYERSETMIIKVSGVILEPIALQDVFFKRGHVAVSLDYDVKKIGDNYYIWAIAPTNENNYTLEIKNIVTIVSGQTREITYEQNFSVSGNLTDYYIKPGFVYSDKDFAVSALLNEDNVKNISINFPFEREILLAPGQNTIRFSIKGLNESGFYNITIGKYILPAYLIANKTAEKIIINETNEAKEPIVLRNLTNETIQNLIRSESANIQKEYYCEEYYGQVCGANEFCHGNGENRTIITKGEKQCCINGRCLAKTSGGGSAWIGYLIAVIVLVAIVFIWIKYKRAKPGKTAIEKAKGK
ncbi:MAG: hypothetical protein QXD13_00330 [Candidatus Pacearchaeota archaeon]